MHKYNGFQEMKMLLDSFIFSNLNYCLLVWHFYSPALWQKIEKIQERAMRLLYNDSYSSYNSLSWRAEQPTIKVIRLRRLAIEDFKTLKSFRLYIHIFQERFTLCYEKKWFVVNRAKSTTTIGEKSLRTWWRQIWNFLPEDVKDLHVKKQSYSDKSIVDFWCALIHYGLLLFFFWWVSDMIRSITVFIQ